MAHTIEITRFSDRHFWHGGYDKAYLVLSAGFPKPDGSPYRNTDEDWGWLSTRVAPVARWLGYAPFERIHDSRNAEAEIYVPEARPALHGFLAEGEQVEIPDLDALLPEPCADGGVRQPYRIILIGEKASLGDVLRPIAERVGAELLLPTGEASTTMIADMAG